MQRLVHVLLRNSNIILKTQRYGLPHGVYQPKYAITVFDAGNDNAYRDQIVHLFKDLVFILHFFVYAVNMLGAALNLCLDFHFHKLVFQLGNNGINLFFPLQPRRGNLIGDLKIFVRMQKFQR